MLFLDTVYIFKVKVKTIQPQIDQLGNRSDKTATKHKLPTMQNALTPALVNQKLNTTWIGQPYHYLPSATSTNDLLKEQAASRSKSPVATGTVLLTDYQEKGKGRLSRRWEAPPGSSLLFSILLRPNWPAERFSWLTMIGGLAVSEAVSRYTALATRLKWPNDCVIKQDGMWKKYCGILLESNFSVSESLTYAVVGIGVNVNIKKADMPPTTFPATSLMEATGSPVSRLDLLTTILERFEQYYELAERDQAPLAAWQERLIFMNRQVIVSMVGKEVEIVGTAVGTDEEGRLLIRDERGILHHIAAGDMTIREYFEP